MTSLHRTTGQPHTSTPKKPITRTIQIASMVPMKPDERCFPAHRKKSVDATGVQIQSQIFIGEW
jgi:hypothetical protein